MLQQRLYSLGPEPRNLGELARDGGAAALTLERDREAVGFVAHALHQKQRLAGARQHHGKRIVGQPKLFEPLRHPGQRDVVDAGLVERAFRRGDLRCTAVDDKQLRSVSVSAVGQFTGLRDKNGKEIYEGDIVKTKEYGIEIPNGKVSFNSVGYDNFIINYIDGGFCLSNNHRCFLLCRGNHLEVNGNIYDNPN